MNKIILFIHVMGSIPFTGYLCFYGVFALIYMVFISPFVFRFWVIPKIEKRYQGVKLTFDYPLYVALPFYEWSIPPVELSFYIVFRYLKWDVLLTRGKYFALDKIHYDVKGASKTEIRASMFTAFIVSSLILLAILTILPPHILN